MYQSRVTAFLDILGFGDLVLSSEGDLALQESISQALSTVSPEKMRSEDFIRVRTDNIPPEELESAIELARLFAVAVQTEAPVSVSYFSDCIAISAESENIMATQTVLDLISKLSIRIWSEHKLTLRGGVTIGSLYHIDGGQIFGPAMNRAYELESRKASTPRILIDPKCMSLFSSQATFRPLNSLVQKAEEGFYQITLGSCYHFMLTTSTWALGDEEYRGTLLDEMLSLPELLEEKQEEHTDCKIKDKYRWLAENCRQFIDKTDQLR